MLHPTSLARGVALVAALALASCASARTPEPKPCGGAAECLRLLCRPDSDAPDLAYALFVLRRQPGSPGLAQEWTRCTRAALPASLGNPPAHCGRPRMPSEGFSPWDLAGAGYREDLAVTLALACAPRAAFLVAATRTWDDDPAVHATLVQAMTNPSRWVARLASRDLLARGDPGALEAAARALADPDAPTRAKAFDDFAQAGRAAQPYVPVVVAAAAGLSPRDRRTLLPILLARVGGEQAGGALATELLKFPAETAALIGACEQLGPDARAAALSLRELATTHAFKYVRERAAQAYESVTGEVIAPGPGKCPRSVHEHDRTTVVQLRDSAVELANLRADDQVRRKHAGRCGKWISDGAAYVGIELGDTCLLGINRGEWGGQVVALMPERDSRQSIYGTNPLMFFSDGLGGAFVLAGIGHMSVVEGWVDHVRRDASGVWQSDPVASLDGEPIAYRVDDGVLTILLEGFEPGCSGENRYVLVRIGPTGIPQALE